jgi:hypothetical protein
MIPDLSDIISGAAEAFDDILNNNGTDCLLIYQGILEQCANCVYDPIGKKSAGRWRSGGPLSFSSGTICPACGGAGTRTTEYSETIKMTIDWHLSGEKGKFAKPITNVRQDTKMY